MRSSGSSRSEPMRRRSSGFAGSGRLLAVHTRARSRGGPVGLAAFAERAGVPLLADPLSGARRGGSAVAHYDLLLRSATLRASLQPQFVLRVGDLPTSKPLRAWLGALTAAAQIAFDPDDT